MLSESEAKSLAHMDYLTEVGWEFPEGLLASPVCSSFIKQPTLLRSQLSWQRRSVSGAVSGQKERPTAPPPILGLAPPSLEQLSREREDGWTVADA
jgi:hypothetical protein